MITREQLDETLTEKLEDMEFQYGALAGKLAMAMDLVNDAEITSGMLQLFCRNGLDPRRPHPDLENLQKTIGVIRMLIKEAFREEQARKNAAGPKT